MVKITFYAQYETCVKNDNAIEMRIDIPSARTYKKN